MALERAPGQPFTRRRMLQLSALGGLALLGGSAVLMGGGGERYRRLLPPGAKPQVLSEKELAVLAVFVERLFPVEPGWLGARESRLAERLDKELTFHPLQLQRDFKAALLLIEHGGLLHLSGTRFTALPPDAQDAHLARMAAGLALERQAVNALKLMAHFFYYCDERTWEAIHYDGPLVQTPSPPEADSRLAPRPS